MLWHSRDVGFLCERRAKGGGKGAAKGVVKPRNVYRICCLRCRAGVITYAPSPRCTRHSSQLSPESPLRAQAGVDTVIQVIATKSLVVLTATKAMPHQALLLSVRSFDNQLYPGPTAPLVASGRHPSLLLPDEFILLLFLQRTTPMSGVKTYATKFVVSVQRSHSVSPIDFASPRGGMHRPPEGGPCIQVPHCSGMCSVYARYIRRFATTPSRCSARTSTRASQTA